MNTKTFLIVVPDTSNDNLLMQELEKLRQRGLILDFS